MTTQTALDELCDLWDCISHHNTDCDTLYSEEREEAYQMAESALENQIPRKPVRVLVGQNGSSTDGCPHCKREFYEKFNFCPKCGQAIDWGG